MSNQIFPHSPEGQPAPNYLMRYHGSTIALYGMLHDAESDEPRVVYQAEDVAPGIKGVTIVSRAIPMAGRLVPALRAEIEVEPRISKLGNAKDLTHLLSSKRHGLLRTLRSNGELAAKIDENAYVAQFADTDVLVTVEGNKVVVDNHTVHKGKTPALDTYISPSMKTSPHATAIMNDFFKAFVNSMDQSARAGMSREGRRTLGPRGLGHIYTINGPARPAPIAPRIESIAPTQKTPAKSLENIGLTASLPESKAHHASLKPSAQPEIAPAKAQRLSIRKLGQTLVDGFLSVSRPQSRKTPPITSIESPMQDKSTSPPVKPPEQSIPPSDTQSILDGLDSTIAKKRDRPQGSDGPPPPPRDLTL